MDLGDIAKTPATGGYPFGAADYPRMAAYLRKFADDIETGKVVLLQVRLIQRTSSEDFYMQSLIVRFAEKQPA